MSGVEPRPRTRAPIGAFIFDLDGVLVDTARFHALAWSRLAAELGFELPESVAEGLKGVSRTRCLEMVLDAGGLRASGGEKARLAGRKNDMYLEYVSGMGPSEILPDARRFVAEARSAGLKTAIASASRNAPLVLERTSLAPLFDAVVDGNSVAAAKPDPEVFLRAAEALGLDPRRCLVFEDAAAGIEAAGRAGMRSVGIGGAAELGGADLVVRGFAGLSAGGVLAMFEGTR